MAQYKLTCPSCHNAYTLRTDSLSVLAGKNFRCTKCGTTLPFSRMIPGVPSTSAGNRPSPRTNIAGPSGIPAAPAGGQHRTVVHSRGRGIILRVKETGKMFPVTEGTYILGRESSDSQATLRIAPDPYMSRAHASLTVSGGPVPQVVITPLNATNAVVVNSRQLKPGQTTRLGNGDNILLGMTNIIVTL